MGSRGILGKSAQDGECASNLDLHKTERWNVGCCLSVLLPMLPDMVDERQCEACSSRCTRISRSCSFSVGSEYCFEKVGGPGGPFIDIERSGCPFIFIPGSEPRLVSVCSMIKATLVKGRV